jgi:hypothetical protein
LETDIPWKQHYYHKPQGTALQKGSGKRQRLDKLLIQEGDRSTYMQRSPSWYIKLLSDFSLIDQVWFNFIAVSSSIIYNL